MSVRWPLAAAALLVLMTCAPRPLSRQSWQRMDGRERALYVRTLLGHEEVLMRKGGGGHRYTSAPAVYVRRIDERFAAGETRPVEEVWADLADGPGQPASMKDRRR